MEPFHIIKKNPTKLTKKEKDFFKKTLLKSSNFKFKLSYYLNKIKYITDVDSIVSIYYLNEEIIGMVVYKEKNNLNSLDIENKFLKEKNIQDLTIIDIDFFYCEKKGFGSKILKQFEEELSKEYKKFSIILYTEHNHFKLDKFYKKNGYKFLFYKLFYLNIYYVKNFNHNLL
jgi:hypothetical protein